MKVGKNRTEKELPSWKCENHRVKGTEERGYLGICRVRLLDESVATGGLTGEPLSEAAGACKDESDPL